MIQPKNNSQIDRTDNETQEKKETENKLISHRLTL